MKNTNIDLLGLKQLYSSNQCASVILDYFASRERSRRETTLDATHANLLTAGVKITRAEIAEVFKKLEDLNCGEYILGRKGHGSRFIWEVNNTEVGRAASGETTKIESIAKNVCADENDTPTIKYKFRFRRDFSVEFELPDDLTDDEAKHIGAHILTLVVKTEPLRSLAA